MNKQTIYNRIPHIIKPIASSLWGYYLSWLRYSKKTVKLVEEANLRENWSPAEWKSWQESKLASVLDVAATSVPYYRNHWQRRRRMGDNSSWELLENWPILEKSTVNNNPEAFISENTAIKHLFLDHTSGTSGKPTLIYLSKNTIQQWYALNEARTRGWYDVSYKDWWGIFGGQKVIDLNRTRPGFWIRNYGLKQIYFSIYHISKETTNDYVRALWKYKPTHLIAYPSALASLASHIIDKKLVPPKMKVIFSNAEKVLDKQKHLIERAFKCPLVETYGMAEIAAAASECEHMNLHWWPEVGYVEVFNENDGEYYKSNDGVGDYVLTGLMNMDMPLIRYRNGDRGALPDWRKTCDCGRKLPLMGPVVGRSKDLFLTQDGRKIYLLDSIFNDLKIVQGQLIQKKFNNFKFLCVPEKEFNQNEAHSKMKRRLSEYFGEVDLLMDIVPEIPKESTGKFRPFICEIN